MFLSIIWLFVNKKILNIIKVISFFANFEKKPNLFEKLRDNNFV